jgi:hypothetical protein
MIEYDLDTEHSILLVHPKSALDRSDFSELARAVDPQIEAAGAGGRGKQHSRNRSGTVNTPVILPALRADHSLNVGLTAPPRSRRLL